MNQSTNTTASIDLAQLDKLRAEFEALARPHRFDLALMPERNKRGPASMYYNARTQHAWEGFLLARRSLTSGAPADTLTPAVIALDAAIHKVLIAGDDSGDELHDVGLRNTLKEAQQVAYRALISIGIEKLPGAVNQLSAFLPKATAPVHDAAAPSAQPALLAEILSLAEQGMCHGLLADDYCSQIVAKIKGEAGAAAKTEQAPEHEPIVKEGGNLVCTACGTTAEIAAVGFDSNMQKVDIATAAGAGSTQPRAEGDERAVLLKLCDQLDAMKRTMFLRPGTGQHYSYLVHEDVQAYVEQARAALARAPLPARPVGQMRTDMERVDVIWFGSKPPHGTNLYAGQIAQPVDDARDAALEEAASVFESAAKHNESKGRTVFAKEQRDRAARMRAAMRANDSAAEGGAK